MTDAFVIFIEDESGEVLHDIHLQWACPVPDVGESIMLNEESLDSQGSKIFGVYTVVGRRFGVTSYRTTATPHILRYYVELVVRLRQLEEPSGE